jgi:hypothetical protein
MWKLIRLAFTRWRRSQEQRLVEGVSQADGRRNVAPQVGDNHLLIDHGAILPYPITTSCQGDRDDPAVTPDAGDVFEVEKRGAQRVGVRHSTRRIGVIGHDGTYRYWEWSDADRRFIPLALPGLMQA